MSGEKPMQLLNRALSVLNVLRDRREGVTLQQLHRSLEIPLGSMHRLLQTLESLQYVQRSAATKRYTLGAAALALGEHDDHGNWIVPPPDALLDAGRESGETVFLTRMVDGRVICVSLVVSVHPLRLFVRVGHEMPLHAAASARVVLAHRDPVLIETLLTAGSRGAYTTRTMREVNQIIDHLADVRRRGFDVCSNELDDGVWAVAAPVFEQDGHVEQGVALAAASGRAESPRRRAEFAAIVLRAAERISQERGWTGGFPWDRSAAALTELFEELGDDDRFAREGLEGRMP
ncbi:MAG: IclR family transcriptional regulator [Microbacterium sp.]